MESQRWYQKNILVIALLILFFPVGLFIMWKYSNWKPRTKWIITGVFIVILLIGQVGNKNNQTTESSPAQTPLPTPKIPSEYERVHYENNPTVENLWYLYSGSDKTEATIEKIAKEIKDKACKKPCNISIYDDRKAIDLDLEYKKISEIEEADSWKEKNYVYVGDHLLGFLEFSSNHFSYFPYKDWFYEELKNKQ